MTPSYANLFLGYFEGKSLENAPFQPTLGCDISIIFLCLQNPNIFYRLSQDIHSTIKFTISHSSTHVPFVDVRVSLSNDGSISTDFHTKLQTNTNIYAIHIMLRSLTY